MTARDDKPTAYEEIDHPPHYGGGADDPYEVIKVIDAWQLGFGTGNAVKYIARAGRKPGSDPVKDLRKALWYLTHELRRLGHDPAAGRGPAPAEAAPFRLNQPVRWGGWGFERGRGHFSGTEACPPGKARVRRATGEFALVPLDTLRPDEDAGPAAQPEAADPAGTVQAEPIPPGWGLAQGDAVEWDSVGDRPRRGVVAGALVGAEGSTPPLPGTAPGWALVKPDDGGPLFLIEPSALRPFAPRPFAPLTPEAP